MSLDSFSKQKQIKLLSQGSYGCIIRPSLKCSGKVGINKYVTKIQRKKSTSERETNIGKIIQTIPNYSQYFAPVIETCEIRMGTIDANQIKKCEFIDNNTAYSSNKILYVGKYTLADYLLYVFQKYPKNFFRELSKTYKDLLMDISKLNDSGIIHFDLRENNILCRDKDGRPIVIDFGLSLTTDIMENDKKSAFFTYGPDYFSWCFDISFLCYIIQYLKETDVVTESISIKIIDSYFLENTGIIELLTDDEKNTYKKNLTEFVKSFENRVVQEVIQELYKYKNSWDNYSVSAIYLTILKMMEIPPSPIVNRFVLFLKDVLLSTPDKRPTSKDSKQMYEKIFSIVSKADNKKLLQDLYNESNDINKNEKRRKNITQSMLMDLKKEERFIQQAMLNI